MFAEQISGIKSLKRIEVCCGCFSDKHRELIKKGLAGLYDWLAHEQDLTAGESRKRLRID
jgi:hypothetical protein